MRYLTLKNLLLLHEQIIAATGGDAGVRDYGRLESVIVGQKQAVFGQVVHASAFDKAAALSRGIIGDHPFVDGNKRTGIVAALLFLEANGYDMVGTADKALEDFAVKIATDRLDVRPIAAWLEAHAAKPLA